MRLSKLQFLFTFIMALLVLASGLMASETRTFSMGQSAGFIRDDSDVILFPGTLNQYNKLVQTEMRFNGGDNAYSGIVHLPLPTTDFNIGANINRPIFDFDDRIGLGSTGIGDDVFVNRVTDLLFGMKMNGNDLGFRVSYGTDSFVQDSTILNPQDIEKSSSYIELAAGLSNKKFDIGANIILPSVSVEVGRDKDELSGFGFNVNGRYFHKINNQMEFIPMGIFGMMSTTLDSGGVTGWTNADLSLMNLFVGGAVNYHVNNESMIVLGLHAYSSQSSTIETDFEEEVETITTFPAVFIGGEARLASWLFGRIGAMQKFQTVTETNKPKGGRETEESTTQSNINFSFGLGMEIGDFLLDVDINDRFFFEGPYFVSGHSRDSQDLFGRLSVTYTFGNDKQEEK